MDIMLYKGEAVILLADPRDTRDKGWILSTDVIDVILTVRETEDSEVIVQLHGEVEKIGESVDDPGKVAVVFESEDTKDLPAGDYWYDVTIITKGHWFDINEYSNLYAKIDYGKIRTGGSWVEVESGWLELNDDTTNFVQVTTEGEYKITSGDYEVDGEGEYVNINLYRIVTLSGEIIDVTPYGDWFEEDTHVGLTFNYKAGKVLDSSNILQDVLAGSVVLKNNITNYIEVSPDGTVSSNITRFTTGNYPLYEVTTSGGAITNADKQETNLILDDRTNLDRGDKYTPSVKAQATVTWVPTKVEEA